jgi:hypothetical protein
MFKYLHNGTYHTDTSLDYLENLGLDEDTIESILNQKEYEEANPAATASNKYITVAAFLARMTVSERHALRQSSDIYVVDIREDLFLREYVDLSSTVLAQGVGYVLNYLSNIPDFQKESVMTVTDTSSRLVEVLVDATQLEKYNGVL